jgi:conjugative relaxase-like TrwC/TraI family protein
MIWRLGSKRVRIGGADHDRVTGNAIWAKCIHRTTRPVSGRVDPHWHCHALLFNATYDETEWRWKAAQLGNVIANKGFYQAAFHSRVAEQLIRAGHRLRRTERDFEMDVFMHEKIRVFCKRTKQIERLERELRTQLESRTGAIVRAAAKRGEFVDYEEQYAAERQSWVPNIARQRTRQDFKARPWTRIGEASWLRVVGMP